MIGVNDRSRRSDPARIPDRTASRDRRPILGGADRFSRDLPRSGRLACDRPDVRARPLDHFVRGGLPSSRPTTSFSTSS